MDPHFRWKHNLSDFHTGSVNAYKPNFCEEGDPKTRMGNLWPPRFCWTPSPISLSQHGPAFMAQITLKIEDSLSIVYYIIIF